MRLDRLLPLLLLGLLVSGSAVAGAPKTKLPDGMRIAVVDHRLVVEQGKRRAPLATEGRAPDSLVEVRLDGNVAKIEYEDACLIPITTSFTLDQLRARLENVAALELHKTKKWSEAAKGFAKAVSLDPDFDLAYVNLASALAAQGKEHDAAVALEPLGKRNPLWLLWRVAEDSELASLSDEPEIEKLRVKTKGTVALGADGAKMPVSVDASGRWVAAPVDEPSWGSTQFERRIEVRELATGKKVVAIPLVRWAETTEDCEEPCKDGLRSGARKAVAARTARVEQVLRDLGFSPSATSEVGKVTEDHERNLVKVTFSKAKLGVVASDSSLRVVRGDKVLVSDESHMGRVLGATLISPTTLVVSWRIAGAEGCESSDPSGLTVLTIP